MFRNVCILITLLSSSFCFAEEQSYVREYTYRASEQDSMVTSRENALLAIKRQLLGELGTFVHSRMDIKSTSYQREFAKQEIKSITEGVVKVSVIDEKWNGFEFYIKANVYADPVEISNRLKNLNKSESINKSIQDQLLISKNAIQELKDEIEKLKNKAKVSGNLSETEQVNNEVVEKNTKLNSYEYLAEANSFYLGSNGKSKNIEQAKKYYVKAAMAGNPDAWFFVDYLHQIDVISLSEYREVNLYRQTEVKHISQDKNKISHKPDSPGWGDWSE